jgi:hypothetical protein
MPKLSTILGTTYQGSIGPQGNAATVSLGATTILTPGSTPTVQNTGNNFNAILSFGVPRLPNILVGTTATGPELSEANVINAGDTNNVVLNFTIPRGNSANIIALSAYGHANGAYLHANGIGARSNSAYLHANGAFNSANSSFSNLNAYFANSSIFLPIYRNSAFINVNYSTTENFNQMSVGPITVSNNITVTVTANSVWKII